MASTLHIPGLAEYGRCKAAFLRSKELLVQEPTPEHKEELSTLLQTLDHAPDAVGFLEAEFGQQYAPVYQQLTGACMPVFLLDEYVADGGKKRLPNDWFDYWSTINDGRVMASMGDLYASFKIIQKMHEGTEQEKAKAKLLVSSLRDDFDWPGKSNFLISSTRLIYSGNSLDTRIVQHYRCNRPELIKETVLEVPVYRRTPIEKIVSQKAGLTYLQTLFDTTNNDETIIQILELMSGKSRNDLVGWTANTTASDTQYTRASHPERAVGFSYLNNQFHVDGDNIISLPGCSRGVRRGASVSEQEAPRGAR